MNDFAGFVVQNYTASLTNNLFRFRTFNLIVFVDGQTVAFLKSNSKIIRQIGFCMSCVKKFFNKISGQNIPPSKLSIKLKSYQEIDRPSNRVHSPLRRRQSRSADVGVPSVQETQKPLSNQREVLK